LWKQHYCSKPPVASDLETIVELRKTPCITSKP
jgi:hypothetical protein